MPPAPSPPVAWPASFATARGKALRRCPPKYFPLLRSLAAHSVVNQLWSVVSFAVDGFAAAGIVLGSRLAAQAHDPSRAPSAQWHLQRLIRRVLFAGFLAGTLAGVVFGVSRDRIIAMFTRDPATVAALTDGTWAVLAAAQPINGLVFVYDGLMYASQSFRFIRNYIVSANLQA